jgi:hypothetical protein
LVGFTHAPPSEEMQKGLLGEVLSPGKTPAAVLRVGVGVWAALIPVRAGAQPKIAQKLVQYQEKLKGPQECDNCLHFVPPSSCKTVEGKINPKGWCQLYAPKPK